MELKREQLILSDDEITRIILKYIDEDIFDYAVMIDGDWGCGKTYFVKESLIEKIRTHEQHKDETKRRNVVYISLYGVNSINEISKEIIIKSYLEKSEKVKGVIQTGAKIFGTALAVLPAFGISIDGSDLSEKLAAFLPTKKCILVFDDLERCNCPINEILGYINAFVEQEGMKVILVANEREIGRSAFQVNHELKYFVAAHPGISFEKTEKSAKITQPACIEKCQQQPTQIDLTTLQKRAEELFGQNEIYEKIKEKLIGNTIHYHPDLQRVFETLINRDGIENELKKLLLEKLSFFEEYMISEGHPNLRTFQFYLSKIQGLYEAINNLDGIGKQAFLKYIVEYCFKICVSYKSGIYKYSWSGNDEYRFQAIGRTDIFGSNLNFRFIDDYIVGSILDLEKAEQLLRVYEKEYIEKDQQELDPLRRLELHWFTSTDVDIEANIEKIIEGLDEDKYDPNAYTRIINILLRLEEIGFSDVNIPMAVSKMKANIRKQTEYIYLSRGFSLDSESNFKERYTNILDELQTEIDKKFQEQATDTIEQFLCEDDSWAENLYEYVRKNYRTIADKTGFLSQLDTDVLITKLRKSKSFDLHAFRACILQLYTTAPVEAALSQDKLLLIELKEGIRKTDMSLLDKIQQAHMKYLISNIDQAIALYNEVEAMPIKQA